MEMEVEMVLEAVEGVLEVGPEVARGARGTVGKSAGFCRAFFGAGFKPRGSMPMPFCDWLPSLSWGRTCGGPWDHQIKLGGSQGNLTAMTISTKTPLGVKV